MNALTTIDEAKPALVAGGRPRPIVPGDIDQIWRIATMVTKAGWAPKDMATNERATVAIMHGLEIGLTPMMALQKIAVINGRPAVWGDAVPGIALSTGQVEDWFEEIRGEGDHMVAVCRVKRKGIKTAKEATFSVADAKRAGLWDTRSKVKRRNKAGEFYEADNDAPWYCYPKRMLTMRSRVAFRDLFADAFGGLYIAEELIGPSEPSEPAPPMRDVSPPRTQAELPPSLPVPVRATATQTFEAGPDECDTGIALTKAIDATLAEDEAPKTRGKKPLPPPARTRVAADAPKAPSAAQADDDIPGFLRRAKPPAEDPEAFLKWADQRLGAATADTIETIWNDEIGPRIDQLLPPDQEEAAALLRKHERRVQP